MKISEYARLYAKRVGASPGYLEQLVVCTKRLDWDIASVTRDQVDEYLTRAMSTLAPSTVSNHRRYLRTLLRAANRDGVNESIAVDFRRVKVPRKIVRAYSLVEIRKIVTAARAATRQFHGAPHSVVLPAWILCAYSTGLRAGDLHSLHRDQISGRRVYCVQRKTQAPHIAVLNDDAFLALEALPYKNRVFADLASRKQLEKALRSVLRSIGMPGSVKWLRRSAATYAEISGMSAMATLGHLTPGLAAKHYVDPLLLTDAKRPLPSAMLADA